jgi:hypothetical protein
MTARLTHLEEIFPNLAAAGYTPKSEKSAVYNCIAYAAGDDSRRWAGYRDVDYFWPEGAEEGLTLSALTSAFQILGYAICDSASLEPGFEKVVLYVDKDGLWTHAAKQTDDGQWTSKLGNLEDIVHRTPEAVAGPDPAYGDVACYMRRKRNAVGEN